jgi:hypothetical protein
MSHTVKQESCLFDVSLNDKFALNTGDVNSQLGTNLFGEMTTTILKISNDVVSGILKDADIKDKLNDVRDIIHMLEKITDKSNFIVEYYNNLTTRLIAGKTCGIVEKEVLRYVSYKSDPELYYKMKVQIADVMESLRTDQFYRDVQINKSAKYADLDLSKFNRDACSFKVVRSYAWDLKKGEKYNVPTELDPYFTLFTKCYAANYPERELSYNHELSTGVIKLNVGAKDYYLHLTLPQMYVLFELNRNKVMTGAQLKIVLGDIPLSHVAAALNTLIFIKLISHESGLANDPNMPFKINEKWSCATDKISLVKTHKTLTSDKQTNNTQLYVSVVNVIRNSTAGLTVEELMQHPLISATSTTASDIAVLLDKILNSGHVEFVGGKYKYVGPQKIEDDSDDFDSSTDDDEDDEDDEENEENDNHTATVKTHSEESC